MRLHFHPFDPFVLILIGYLLVSLIQNWDMYNSCYTPMNIFLLVSYLMILVHRALDFAKSNLFRYKIIRNTLTILLYFGINPFFIYWTVQGIQWDMANNENTPICIGDEDQQFLNKWIGLLVFLDIVIIIYNIAKLVQLYAMIQYRRRLQNLLARLIDYEEETLRRILIMTAEDYNPPQGNGLTAEEISRIKKEKYRSSIVNYPTVDDMCIICLEGFEEEEDIRRLPGCKHAFHPNCIENWLSQSSVCPICRSDIKSKLPEEPEIVVSYKSVESGGNVAEV